MSKGGLRGWLTRNIGRRLGGRALAEAEAEARRAEARLREAIDVLPEGVVFLDAEGRYILWNRRYAEIYHRSADLFSPGARLADTLRVGVARGDYPDAIGREEEWLAARIEKLTAPTGERHEQRLADGRWLMIEERRTADGGVIGLRVDITQLKRQAADLEDALHRAEAASRAKSEFLADMSHELRTPLNGVMGLALALERQGLTEDQRAIVGEILDSARALDDLVNNLLDYGDAAREADTAPTAGPMVHAPDAPPLRVLAADDNPTNRRVIELMLGAAGADVVSVEDGAQAVQAWRGGAFDLVLMDLRMPIMDGLDAIRAIRRAEGAGLPRAPIIVISANTSPGDLEASKAAGADRHIAKPVRAEALFEAISEVLES
ncbi:MAG: response regulator [Phenylobacterium sp.]|uniref:hybrid sensor histidine kinase/response regulator n=1 Tax=Phenylobacterium sp. TaxID=1871053 RepID=UPI0027341A17|nr:response regulator [Phenylobacterium sp.]MDP3746829.1 response regulator [Phenylobacterium sp.]